MQDFRDKWIVHQDLYYRVAFMILGDRAEAMDIVQEVYVKLWKSRESLSTVKNPEGYGASLVRNMCIDLLRHRNIHPPAPLEAISDMTSGANSDGKILADENMELLARAMKKMTPRQRELVKLKYFEGLEYDEIRLRTGLSAVNIRVILSRARSIIKKTI